MKQTKNITTIKTKIEKETNLKIDVKKIKTGSMRGYVTFSTKIINNELQEWGFDYGRMLVNKFGNGDVNPTFTNSRSLSVYIGNEVFN